MLESDPNLEKNVMIHLDVEKMITPFYKFYYDKSNLSLIFMKENPF